MKPLLFSALGAVALGVSQPASADDAPMTQVSMTKVADGVYHFFAMTYSSMVVVGDDGVLITDPAFTPRAEILQAEIAKLTDKPVTHVALSHEHFDHVGGTDTFAGATVIAQEKVRDFADLSPLMPFPEIDQTFAHETTVDLGGLSVELKHIAVGDGVATTVARVPETNTVFSVDMYEPDAFTVHEFKEDTNFIGVRKILNTMSDWQPAYAINGHSQGNSVEALHENAEMMNRLYDAVLPEFQSALASGDPAAPWMLLFSISDQIRMEEYADWKDYDTAFPAYVRRMALSIMHGG